MQIESEIDRWVAEAPSLVLACLSPQHVDRLTAFYRAAQSSGRELAVDLYTAFVMHLAASETELPRPTRKNGVRVFVPQAVTQGGRHQRLANLIRRYGEDAISVQEVLKEPSRFVCTFRESMLKSDFGGELPERTLCLYGRWSGYLDQPSWEPMRQALVSSNGELRVVHATGHLLEQDIERLVRAIGPKRIVPIHTFEPQRVAALHRPSARHQG